MVHCQTVAIVDSSTVVFPYVLLCAFDQSFVLMSQLKQTFRLIYFPDILNDVELILCITLNIYTFVKSKL